MTVSPTTLGAVLRADPDPGLVSDRIACEVVGAVAVVTLSDVRSHNALNYGSWTRLAGLFGELHAMPGLRAVVVKGAGPRAFAAGADIAEFRQKRTTPGDAIAYNAAIAATLEAVQSIAVPVVAMIGGLAVGGGCELAAACDMRIAGSTSLLGIPIGSLGVTLGYTEARILTQLIGPAALKYLLMSGELLTADAALRIGLLNAVVAVEDLVPTVVGIVDKVLASSAVTMRAAKQVVDMCGRALSPADTETLMKLTADAYGGTDLREGIAAFLDKREPVFGTNTGGLNGSA